MKHYSKNPSVYLVVRPTTAKDSGYSSAKSKSRPDSEPAQLSTPQFSIQDETTAAHSQTAGPGAEYSAESGIASKESLVSGAI